MNDLDRMRELREWHYQQMTQARALSRNATSGALAERFAKEADRHLRFVQTLNDYFPAGDNAG